jgi:hypothetical protein
MPARVTVYCRDEVRLRVADLRAAIDEADLMTLAEGLDLPEGEEAAVDAMWPHLRFDAADDAPLAVTHLRWAPDRRPIRIERVLDIRADIAEILDELPRAGRGARRVRAHLAACTNLVDFEMGIDDSQHLAATLSEVLAFAIAERFGGLVWFYRREWAGPDDRGETILTTP